MKVTAQDLYKIVRIYAFEIGKPIFTWEQFEVALFNYQVFAAARN